MEKQPHDPEHLVWHSSQVSPADREALLKQSPQTLWLTGLSGSGKSTLAFALERTLLDLGRLAYALDGDNVRQGLCRDLGFSPADRSENIRRIAEVAQLMNDAGLIVIASFISPYREDREMARSIIGRHRFVEVFVSTPLETCVSRDPKGLYRKAKAGELKDFTGVSSPYEQPLDADLCLDTSELSVSECLEQILPMISRATR
ncbi:MULTISPECIES: adenylyl-sulfate kinase [Pseudomonas]|uniref:adenylyl-sulfate kinase n=1 Tax=Pseudomonas TaxID=286 RepID=UPI000C070BF0|nr:MULTISPECIES: adenylyl-sulfate kinase [Pseudomonas]MCO5367629.1 adenylyl-sulfate kinase [Pseudomonas alliivorans]MEE5040788.1 adenylyl-sulfate kinase [Pseudomonas alliivorans]MEE5154450.1 adenylyl-sulfate kinase [Pseudomonas alliivorans]PHN55485.1 adenylylsulfate kinase [Pseudomonas viridiflava]